jgi:cytochrome c-type biogenesis protein
MDISLIAAFLAGMASLLSPCVLPLLPTYFVFLGGNSEKKVEGMSSGQWVLLRNAFFFLCGFTMVFIIMGASASLIGQLFFDYQEVIRKIGGIFMVVMGIQLTGLLSISFLQQERRPLLQYAFQGPLGAFVFGAAVTVGWTPCIGPILASILMYAGTEEMVNHGAILLFVYAMGFCVPFMMLAFLYQKFLFRWTGIYAWLPWIQRVSGIGIIMVGVIIYFDVMNTILAMLARYW